jgi:hypothetical protein
MIAAPEKNVNNKKPESQSDRAFLFTETEK